ncbi:MAG: hypothetical protein K2X27_25465 [Candidatus Obscuribacterales bacterium]|nr:hypothetical protein [Candidatus Obscuribacterales bacterium]
MPENFDPETHSHILDRRIIEFDNAHNLKALQALREEINTINNENSKRPQIAADVWNNSVTKGKAQSATHVEFTPLEGLKIHPHSKDLVIQTETRFSRIDPNLHFNKDDQDIYLTLLEKSQEKKERAQAIREAEIAKQETAKQEAAKQEAAKQEAAKQEAAKQEAARQEAAKQEAAKIEARCKENQRQLRGISDGIKEFSNFANNTLDEADDIRYRLHKLLGEPNPPPSLKTLESERKAEIQQKQSEISSQSRR